MNCPVHPCSVCHPSGCAGHVSPALRGFIVPDAGKCPLPPKLALAPGGEGLFYWRGN